MRFVGKYNPGGLTIWPPSWSHPLCIEPVKPIVRHGTRLCDPRCAFGWHSGVRDAL